MFSTIPWFVAALLGGVLWGIIAIMRKHFLQDVDMVVFSALYSTAGMAVLLPVLVVRYSTIEVILTDPYLLIGLFVSGAMNVVGFYVYNRALHQGEISTVMPLRKLNIVFIAILSALLLDEWLSYLNTAGMLIVMIATYVLLVRSEDFILKPFVRLVRSPGPMFALLSAFIYSTASIADRFVTSQFSPIVYTALIYVIMATSFLSMAALRHRSQLYQVINNGHPWWVYGVFGIATAGASLATFTAFSKTYASKVVPVMQVQLLFSLYAGHQLFDESALLRKAVAIAAMVGGIVLVVY